MFMYYSKANCRKRKVEVYVQSVCTEIDTRHSFESGGLRTEQSNPRQPGRAEERAALCLPVSCVAKGGRAEEEAARSCSTGLCLQTILCIFVCIIVWGFFQAKISPVTLVSSRRELKN